jgi:HK97 family phage major capsid protein
MSPHSLPQPVVVSGVAPTVTVEAEAGAVSNTGMVTEYLTGTVNKYSGMNTISVELLERSDPNFYAELTNQLQNAYLTAIDTAVLTALLAAGTNAQLLQLIATELSLTAHKLQSLYMKTPVTLRRTTSVTVRNGSY